MDYAASTPLDKEILDEILPFFDKYYGNPSSIHSFGIDAFNAIEEARESVAKIIGAKNDEILFTAGGTESDNIALKGVAFKNKKVKNSKGYNIITCTIEHPAILETCKYLYNIGYKVKYIPVDKYGIVNLEELEKAISRDTILISIMFANNEIGTIEPIKEIGKIAKERDVLFHTDAVQAIGKVPIDINKLNIDLLSISSHKIYGPKGVGALYIRNGVKLHTFTHGGGHEKGIRSSTYNTPGIVGLGKACELGLKRLNKDVIHMTKLRDILINNILKIEESYLNGHPIHRLANNAHFRFTAIDGESLNILLNDAGIATATGSACSSKKLKASHVLTGIGLTPELAQGSLRLSLGRKSTIEEVNYVSNIIPGIVKKLRKISPLWNT
jgi:cysteine desulfurase